MVPSWVLRRRSETGARCWRERYEEGSMAGLPLLLIISWGSEVVIQALAGAGSARDLLD